MVDRRRPNAHLDDVWVARWRAGEVSVKESRIAERHAAGCRRCRDRILGPQGPPPLPYDLRARVLSRPPELPLHFPPPLVGDRYVVDPEWYVGGGVAGWVFAAFDRKTASWVTAKFYKPAGAGGVGLSHAENEVFRARRVRSGHVLAVHDCEDSGAGGWTCMVSEFLLGPDLAEFAAGHLAGLPPACRADWVVAVGLQLLRGLRDIHTAGFTHGDPRLPNAKFLHPLSPGADPSHAIVKWLDLSAACELPADPVSRREAEQAELRAVGELLRGMLAASGGVSRHLLRLTDVAGYPSVDAAVAGFERRHGRRLARRVVRVLALVAGGLLAVATAFAAAAVWNGWEADRSRQLATERQRDADALRSDLIREGEKHAQTQRRDLVRRGLDYLRHRRDVGDEPSERERLTAGHDLSGLRDKRKALADLGRPADRPYLDYADAVEAAIRRDSDAALAATAAWAEGDGPEPHDPALDFAAARLRGDTLLGVGRCGEADRAYALAEAASPGDPSVALLRGLGALNDGRDSVADEHLKRAAAPSDRGNPFLPAFAWGLRGVAGVRGDQYRDAAKRFDNAVQTLTAIPHSDRDQDAGVWRALFLANRAACLRQASGGGPTQDLFDPFDTAASACEVAAAQPHGKYLGPVAVELRVFAHYFTKTKRQNAIDKGVATAKRDGLLSCLRRLDELGRQPGWEPVFPDVVGIAHLARGLALYDLAQVIDIKEWEKELEAAAEELTAAEQNLECTGGRFERATALQFFASAVRNFPRFKRSEMERAVDAAGRAESLYTEMLAALRDRPKDDPRRKILNDHITETSKLRSSCEKKLDKGTKTLQSAGTNNR